MEGAIMLNALTVTQRAYSFPISSHQTIQNHRMLSIMSLSVNSCPAGTLR